LTEADNENQSFDVLLVGTNCHTNALWGTPFCFNSQNMDYPFGAFKNVKNGGRVIVMGDGMVSLYMTSWKGVDDYQCAEFMHDVFRWLLHESE
jgi:hypothetical protein